MYMVLTKHHLHDHIYIYMNTNPKWSLAFITNKKLISTNKHKRLGFLREVTYLYEHLFKVYPRDMLLAHSSEPVCLKAKD